MQANMFKAILRQLGFATAVLLTANTAALAGEINLTAAPASALLPDGESVPMWGYSCGTPVEQSGVSNPATCRRLNPDTTSSWSPVLITVAQGSLTINLTNNLPDPPGAAPGTPTSLVIVGQLGGGLGTSRTTTASPEHAPQGTTWPGTRGDADTSTCGPGAEPGAAGAAGTFCPPAQGPRVQSMATEVGNAATTPLTWSNLKPGSYLIESGTHPSIQGPMGLYGVLVVTAPDSGSLHQAYPGVTYNSDVALLLSEIDPVQNNAVADAVGTAGFSETKVWSGQAGQCGDVPPSPTAVAGVANTCYPPAVNYDPRYYLINGVSFDRAAPGASRFTYAPPGASGHVLVRFVNAGLRMHAPSIVGAVTGTGTVGFSLIAEDGNVLPGTPRVQSNVLLPAGKTYDVLMNAPATGAPVPVFDRQLSLSTNNQRDGGMQAYINATDGAAPAAATPDANDDTYNVVAGNPLTVSELAKGLLANDVGVYGVQISGTAPAGLILNSNGTFAFSGAVGTTGTTFSYCGTGAASGACATVHLNNCASVTGCMGGAPIAIADAYSSNIASRLQVSRPGVLGNDTDPSGLPLIATIDSVTNGNVTLNPDGSFVATPGSGATATFTYHASNSQHTSSGVVTATVTFKAGSGVTFAVRDAKTGEALDDYRWIIEEDRTVGIDPALETTPPCTSPGVPAGCSDTPVRNLAVNFHSSHMPVIATGCTGPLSCEGGELPQTVLDPATGMHVPAVCDIGNGACRPDPSADHSGKTPVSPSQVALDPTKRYYISVLPGDAANDTEESAAHSMGGAQISSAQVAGGVASTVDVFVQPLPFPTAKISVYVFQDDYPLNGESDTGGGVDVLAPNEPGLGGFNIVLLDKTGQFGDAAGQLTYNEFGNPVSNALAGRIDPLTGLNACPISPTADNDVVGQIVTCPTYEANLDGSPTTVLSPLAGHAVIADMYPGLYEVHTTPAADRIARGEEWLQTNTLDGTKDIEAFIKPDEPAYFQEFGPGGYHVAVGFANPAIIKARKASVCAGTPNPCTATINGIVTGLRMSRTPDQRVYSSGSYDMYSFGQCYVSLGAPDSADFDFAKCDDQGRFTFTNVPQGNMKVTVFDQWNDLLVDGLSTPIKVAGATVGTPEQPLEIAVTQWRMNLYGRIFLDQDGDGVSDDEEPGLPLVPYNIRYRDGSYVGFNNTDLAGFAGFNEVFPFLNWMVVDTDSARHKLTGVHVVYDAGGPVDGTTGGGTSVIASKFANTIESSTAHLPAELRVPGARYCADADCDTTGDGSTGRVDPGWVPSEGWQGLLGNNSFIDFAMRAFGPTENGGIRGHVIYTSTRPFDDPALLLQLSWEPAVPNVKINLYQQSTAPDGTKSLKLVDTTTTTSWDDWAQGFRRNPDGTLATTAGKYIPNMNCPGQETDSPFYFTMENSTQALNPGMPIAANARFKCYDGWSMFNQVQPAPYNGMYKFPSVVAKASATRTLPAAGEATYLQLDPTTYKTNCTICGDGPDGTPMLPPGKYVVEIVVPDGYELVKEEDKNILLGDVYTATVTQQFAGFGNIYILPDQASVNAYYNKYNSLQSTANNNASPRREGDTGSIEVFWPCVGENRIVPDYNSLFPGAGQAAPFAGATRPLCDRKEVTLENQMTALTKFYVFTSAHIAGHFAGTITNDFAAEFDPFSPQFGEKFAVPNSPVAIKDFTGKEISRVYSDQWGFYNGLTYSTWTVNPPSPSGYIPQMMIACMNDPGPIPGPGGTTITDPLYSPGYSDFCYEWPFMPGQTAYMDTPVIPTMAFADGYNLPDCEYPDATPAIASVTGDAIPGPSGRGPWVSASGAGHTLTITALGDKRVLNHAYSGPRAVDQPFNQKFITRHYNFGPPPSTCPATGPCPNVTIAGVPMTEVSWSADGMTITGTVPTIPASLDTTTGVGSTCSSTATPGAGQTPRQRVVSGSPTTAQNNNYRCGELVITAANGKKSVDTVTVTVAGKPPTYVPAGTSLQARIDSATSGDLLILGPGEFRENLLMWKPIRLQGVGAASVTINGDSHPAGKMDAWRQQVVCLFGLTLDGRPAGVPYAGCPASKFWKVDRNNREGILGWDATSNGNLAQLLQEPTLMGAYEGAGITVLGKGVSFPVGEDPFAAANEGAFPDGTRYLNANTGNGNNNDCRANAPTNVFGRDNTTSNFLCNPSRIDGLSVINSSQGGGGIFLHGWNHQVEIANNRVYANHGSLTGGITVGSGEFTVPYIVGGVEPIPFNVPGGLPDGTQLGYGMNTDVRVHHNSVTDNLSIGDALYSGTNSAAGGVTFCTGSDRYRFNDNWVCGNLSAGDGGGVVHSGFINDGVIARNWILFNQSQNPTIPTNGGGLAVLGASPDRILTTTGLECGSTNDLDCPPALPEGTGHNLLIDANLIMGNSAESGTGGGLRLQLVNGDDVIAFPTRPNPITSGNINNRSPGWNDVTVTNNIIANNVAGWDGAGVSLQDALKVRFINNTVVANDATASAGVLFNTIGAPMASVPAPGCNPQEDPTLPQDPSCINPVTTSTDQVAGLVTMRNTPNLVAAINDLNLGAPGTQLACPSGFGYGATLNEGSCRSISLPAVSNDLFWQNRSFHIGVGGLGTGQQNQQAVVTLYPSLDQGLVTGTCPASGTGDPDQNVTGTINASSTPVYWDIGVRGDTTPTPNSGSGFTLSPGFSILTNAGAYPGASNVLPGATNAAGMPLLFSRYCNGSRIPPENAGPGTPGFHGYNAPPGRSETTGQYTVFAINQITPAATIDEGNNWINLGYGPLSLGHPVTQTTLGNYAITPTSPAGGVATASGAPNHDFFGNARPLGTGFDIGAVEIPDTGPPPPVIPTLTVLDLFNRANSGTLGANWSQPTTNIGLLCLISGAPAPCANIRVNSNQALSVTLTGLTAFAHWNGAGGVFGSRQAAAFTFVNAPGSNTALTLKETGGSTLTPANFIRVVYATGGGGTITIQTTTNSGGTYTDAGATITGFGGLAANDILTAFVDQNGVVYVWKNTTFIGSRTPTANALWSTGGGRIGMQLPNNNNRVDNFAGGTVP